MTALGHEPHHYTIFYVQVDDVQAYLDKAAALGAKTLVPPVHDSYGHLRVAARSRRKYSGAVERCAREIVAGCARYESRSKIPAAPMPPPTHIVTKP